MRKAGFYCVRMNFIVLVGCIVAIACKTTAAPPPAQAGYPAPATGASPIQQPPGYSDGTAQQTAPVEAATPGAVPAGMLSQPGPFATPCQNDGPCLTHHCNVAAGKCAFPCQTDSDCTPGNRCVAPACLPKFQ
jgi:hypothetical protein